MAEMWPKLLCNSKPRKFLETRWLDVGCARLFSLPYRRYLELGGLNQVYESKSLLPNISRIKKIARQGLIWQRAYLSFVCTYMFEGPFNLNMI